MFTGLIEEVGSVVSLQIDAADRVLEIRAQLCSHDAQPGDSIAINGCCLTVTNRRDHLLTFDLLRETADRTNLAGLHAGNRVNLERALAANSRLGGHFVQGHIDCVAKVLLSEYQGPDLRVEIQLPTEFAQYAAAKGSIAVNGISLTVAEVMSDRFSVWIIPHTRAATNVDGLADGELVNLEFDLIAKYLARMLDQQLAAK